MIQKSPRWKCKSLTDLAKHYECQNCSQHGMSVSAHSNQGEHGKGMGMKAHDCFVAFLCHRCHTWLDQGNGMDPTGVYSDKDKAEMWRRAHDRTLLALFRDGRVRVAN